MFFSGRNADKTFVRILTYEENEIFVSIPNLILTQEVISDKYSGKYINEQLVDLYHKLLKDDSVLDTEIENLTKRFFETPAEGYQVFSELENIRIVDDQSYWLIESEIKIFDRTPKSTEMDQRITAEMLNKPAIFTIVKAAESEKAEELALQNFGASLNLLRLYLPSFKPVLKGELLSRTRSLYLFNKTRKQSGMHVETVGDLPLNEAYLSKELYDKLIEFGIDGLKNDSPMSKAIKEGLYWFGLGLEEKHRSAKLVNFVTVMESVLKLEDEHTELARAVSERGALLIYDDLNSRMKARNELMKIYGIRSGVVHSGTLISEKDASSPAGGYARAILINLIKSNKRFNGNFNDFIKKLDEIKFTGKRFSE